MPQKMFIPIPTRHIFQSLSLSVCVCGSMCEPELVNEGKETKFKGNLTFGELKRNCANRSAIDKSLFGFNSNLFIFLHAQVIQSFMEHVVFLMCIQRHNGKHH